MISPQTLETTRASTLFTSLVSADLADCQLAAALPNQSRWYPVGRRAHRFLSQYLMTHFRLGDIQLSAKKGTAIYAILLLHSAQLICFARYLGTLLVASEVRHAIRRADVSAYRVALGDELYSFQMDRALLLTNFSASKQCFGPERIARAVDAAGFMGLKHLIESHCPELWVRLQLKLPHAWLSLPDPGLSLPSGDALNALIRRLCRELEIL